MSDDTSPQMQIWNTAISVALSVLTNLAMGNEILNMSQTRIIVVYISVARIIWFKVCWYDRQCRSTLLPCEFTLYILSF